MDAIRVLVVDDQELVRSGFAMVIDSQPDMAVVGQAGDGHSALKAALAQRPDIV
ncbi:MAG: DNA-binding response regulator, partial [Bifidobacteriaceae bacterium]|nr:DNA-binding response regulator [Bifidobacteriaceae bacterium]